MGEEYLQEEVYDFNTFFKVLKTVCKNFKKEEFIFSRRLLDIDKKEILIFEINKEQISSEDNEKELVIPMDKFFIEIPKWNYKFGDTHIQNLGGILFIKEKISTWNKLTSISEDINRTIPDREIFTASTFWLITNKKTNFLSVKPMGLMFFDGIKNDSTKIKDLIKLGSTWKKNFVNNLINENTLGINETLKMDLGEFARLGILSILNKVNNKEYTSYKKWTPCGYETKEIVYSRDVMTHKRHFWKDSGKFIIPTLPKEELIKKGYGIDEVVYRNGELRRDVPFTLINQYIIGKGKKIKKDNRVISFIKRKNLRQEDKIYKILLSLLPTNIIRRHDRKTLKGIELDFNIPELRLGIEYDGEQHFDKELYKKLYGDGFDEQVKRDKLKNKLCSRKNIKLIRIKYNEPLTKTHIKNKIKKCGVI